MQDWRALTPDAYRQIPWKNGLGVTTLLAVSPPGASEADFVWRISRATIASSGPFSAFPGCERAIVHLSGGTVHLRHGDAEPVPLLPFRPHTFSGDGLTTATLDGPPAEDFNLMTRRDLCRGMLMFDDLPLGTPHLLAAGRSTTHFVYVLRGGVQVSSGHGSPSLAADILGSLVGPATVPLQLKAVKPHTAYLLATITLGT